MIRNTTIKPVVFLGCAALLVAVRASADQPIAELRQYTGQVSIRHTNQWQTVTTSPPISLYEGDKVVTDRGRAEIYFPDDESTLTLDVGTNITIHQPATQSLFRKVELYLGDLFFHVNKAEQNKWQFVTPTAVGGVRGTKGEIVVEDETNSHFNVAEGQVQVNQVDERGNPGGEGVLLNGGEGVGAVRGQPLRPQKLPKLPSPPKVEGVKADELPEPRQNRWDKVKEGERPPTVEEKTAGAKGAGTKKGAGEKRQQQTRPPRILRRRR